MTPEPDAQAAQAAALLRRQLVITVLGLGVFLIVLAFTRSQGAAPAPASPVDHYVQAHLPPDPGSLRLAYLQLAVAALAAAIALGHAARVAAFVFRRKAF